MAKLLTPYLFTWKEVEAKSDLERLMLVLEHLPDEGLMQKLEEQRKWGRNDYPIRPVWNSVLAGVVYQHESIDSLRRELLRNGELRERCGFDPHRGSEAVPPSWVYTRFLGLLFKFKAQIDGMFGRLVDELKALLPDLGFSVAVDSKGVNSAGRSTKETEEDGRRDVDADWGRKTYRGKREDGTLWEKVVKWFGYKIHLMVDTKYEMPLGYRVTRASVSDSPQLLPL
ncbi:MAG TPA: transposase, partial [Thermodesulfobacteriota bacterium]|nr:transposase [Thermodesulfobacteriota bacterium]